MPIGTAQQSAAKQAGPSNTIHTFGQDLDRLHADLDSADAKGPRPKRDFMRYPFRNPTLRVDVKQPGGGFTTLYYACRDLSGAGVSVLHSAYVHVGGSCLVHLPHPVHGLTPVQSKIVRCRHVKGTIHEVGIKFNQTVKVREFLNLDPFEGRFTLERVNPEKLTGGLLHIEGSAMDRKLLRHFLKDTGLNVVSAEDGASGLKRASEGFDIIVCDFTLPDTDGAKLVEDLRAASVQTPVIIASADTSPMTREKIRACRAAAFLCKPMTEETVLRAVAEFLLLGGTGGDGGGVMCSSLPEDDPRQQFLSEFCQEMKKTSATLAKLIESDDLEAVKRVCFQVKGAAPAMGFESLAGMADAALKAVNASMSIQESMKPLRTLVSACQRIKAGRGSLKAA